MRGTSAATLDPPPPVEREWNPTRRLVISQAVFLSFTLLLVGQLIRWQVLERSSLIAEARGHKLYREQVPARRGLILDHEHAVLALNTYDYTIIAAPNMIAEKDTPAVAARLSELLGVPRDELLPKLEGDALYALISPRVPREVGKAVMSAHLPGIFAQPLAVRVYPEHTLAAHTLGFVAGGEDGGTQGYYGVEGFYDKVLKGEEGFREGQWDPWDRPVSFADIRARVWKLPQEGRTLVLTIDRTIQYLIERELEAAVKRYGAEGGCIVVMDPKSGALLAMASYPTYDPNRFVETDQKVFIDPIIGRQYEPGSTFKVVTMAAALDAGVVRPDDVYNDIGYIEVGGRVLKNWDKRAHGPVTMTDILVHSLNTGIAHVSTLLGPELFYGYVERFGFGHKTGVDLQGEVAGALRERGDPDWHESDLGTNAFGQGLAVTPLQMVCAVGAIANHGLLMRPYVVDQIVDGDRVIKARHVAVRQVIREETARTLTEMMVKVVEQGATQARVEGYRIAGKTGTAQTPIVGGYDPSLTIASFVGFAPADDPRFVVLVRLDKPKTSPWGATTAAPTFANVARILFTQLEIPPDRVRLAESAVQ